VNKKRVEVTIPKPHEYYYRFMPLFRLTRQRVQLGTVFALVVGLRFCVY